MFSVWLLEQRVIISLHIIILLFFITRAECVYCVVRTDAFRCFRFILVKELIMTYNSHRKSNKMQQCIKVSYYIYMKLNMFRATHRPSSGA